MGDKHPLRHEFLPLPVGRLSLTAQQVESLVKDLRCNVCGDIPEFEQCHETPCCSHVVCPACIKLLLSSKIGDLTRTRHKCPFCRFGDDQSETFSTRALVRSSLKVALSAALFESPAEWNRAEKIDTQVAWKQHKERSDAFRAEARAMREREEVAAAEAEREKEAERAAAKGKKRERPPEPSPGKQKPAANTAVERAVVSAAAAASAAAAPARPKRQPKLAAEGGGGGGGGGGSAPPIASADGEEWTREWTPSVEALVKGVAILALRPHARPPPEACSPMPLPPLPEHSTIVSVPPGYTDAHLRAFIELHLRATEGSLPSDAPFPGAPAEGGGAGGAEVPPDAPPREWGKGVGERVALYISLDDPAARSAPPSQSRAWPEGRSLAEVLLDTTVWNVEKLEDEVLVVYYAMKDGQVAD
jgi:hypothetical protein